MKIIIVQGMSCLGKTTLCRQLGKYLPKCKCFSLDEYKEKMWDTFGFSSVGQREHQSRLAKQLFYYEINEAVKNREYKYILIEYAFTEKYWNEMLDNIRRWDVLVKTIYLKPADLHEHKRVWESRSRDFSTRHAGHGATCYYDGVGSGYVNKYDDKVFETMPVYGKTLEIEVYFDPYSINKSNNDILDFIDG